jgi:UDP-GlcNAc3NAcA epimerase
MKLLSIVGARPQFIKLAPFVRSINNYNRGKHNSIKHIIIHTGQHYDVGMSDIFFKELNIPEADCNLGIGSGLHGMQTGKMLIAIEKKLIELKPDIVITYGDTNSTLAGALAASKLHIKLAHIEAGLRSFNRKMPEELNRIASDHLSDFLFAPTQTAVNNLSNEGLRDKTILSGDIMFDAILFNKVIAGKKSSIIKFFQLENKKYAVITLHRAENTDNIFNLKNILAAVNKIAASGLKIVFPVHPRTAKFIKTKMGKWKPDPNLNLIKPIGYLDMISLVDNSSMVLTDSGGLQKEAFFLRIPCITLRNETEWIETVEGKGNIVASVSIGKILNAVEYFKQTEGNSITDSKQYFGNGNASRIILDYLLNFRDY